MIRCYGLFWREAEVIWGAQGIGNEGRLLGATSRSGKNPVNFRDQRGIYALYADYKLLYVGQAGRGNDKRLFKRLKDHRKDHMANRWNQFSWFGMRGVTQRRQLANDNQNVNVSARDALDFLEAVAIAIAEPNLNRQIGRWNGASQYYQVPLDSDNAE